MFCYRYLYWCLPTVAEATDRVLNLMFKNSDCSLCWRLFTAIISRVANSQTLVWDLRLFVILQTFFTTFLYMLKTKTFCTPHHKTTGKHPRIKEFRLYFAKKNSVIPNKNGKSATICMCLGRPMACGNALVMHLAKFPQIFLKHNVGNPDHQKEEILTDSNIKCTYTNCLRN